MRPGTIGIALLLSSLVCGLRANAAAEALPPSIAAWSNDPFEVCIAFGQPFDPSVAKAATKAVTEYDRDDRGGTNVSLRKRVVSAEGRSTNASTRLRVLSASVSADRRTLLLATDPPPLAVRYRLTLPGISFAGSNSPPVTLEAAYDLRGVAASWSRESSGSPASWSGWLPSLDTEVCRRRLVGSTWHQQLFACLRQPGFLTLRTLLAPPASSATLELSSLAPMRVTLDGHSLKPTRGDDGREVCQIRLEPATDYHQLTVVLTTGLRFDESGLRAAGAIDKARRGQDTAVALYVPWAPRLRQPPMPCHPAPSLAGGDFQRGKALFTGNQLKCSGCHPFRGEGGHVGPDLGTLYQRDATSVLNDILDPSARLNPDYVSFDVTLQGDVDISAFVHLQPDGSVQLMESDGKTNTVQRSEIQAIRASAVSMMPTGLLQGLDQNQIRDLLTFLLSTPSRQ